MNEAVAAWRGLQAEITDSADWIEAVMGDISDRRLVYDGQPAMVVAEPVFVTEQQWRQDQEVARCVLQSLVAAGRFCLDNPDAAGRYVGGWLDGVPDADLFALPPGYPNPVVLGRLDGVRTDDGLKVLEFNGGLPGGVMPTDASARVLLDTDLAERFAAEHPFDAAPIGQDVVDALVCTWHDFGGTDLPYVAVALPKELTDLTANGLNYLSGIAGARGIEIAVADPAEMIFSDGRLRLNGRAIDVLVRAFFTPMFGYLGQRLDGIKAALRAQAVCMIASLQSGLFGLKSLFALVTDPHVDLGLEPSVVDFARKALPWTRMVEDARTTDFAGDWVSLPEFLARERENLVIKPTEGYGGVGVELGWRHTPDSWADVIARGLAGGHVAQQKVPIAGQDFSVLEPGFPVRTFTADTNPFLCAGKVSGYYVRLARETGGMTNVTGGGATVAPTFRLQ